VPDNPVKVRIRPHSRQTDGWLVGAVVWAAVVAFTYPDAEWSDFWLSAVWTLSFFLSGRQGITLTPDVAVVHRWRSRRVPWAEVQAVTLEQRLGGTVVTLWAVDRKRISLSAPGRGFGWDNPRLEREWQTIGEWWVAHRGADWRPGYREPGNRRTATSG
jgi:hypothetical protein